jgi:hypothetical protein
MVSPLGALAAIIILGISVEAVERKSPQAAIALVVLLLLGIITFNSKEFYKQIAITMSALNAPSRATGTSASGERARYTNPTVATPIPLPQTGTPSANPGQKPREGTAATPTPFK